MLLEEGKAPGTGPGPAGRVRARPATAAWTAAAWAGALAALAAVLRDIGAGFDLSDEASYLLAADPPAPGDAFNGFSGRYLRGLWVLTQWDVTAVRISGLAGLVAVAVVLGLATARLARMPRAVVVAVTVAAATGYYAQGLRTPSYNWLALVGAGLATAAALHLLAGGRPKWGALAGAGAAVAAAGKIPTGLVLLVVVAAAAVLARRPSAVAWASAAFGSAALLHALLVLPPAESVQLLRRSAAMMAAVDPDHYTPLGSVRSLGVAILLALLTSATTGGLLGLLPLAAGLSPARRETWFAGATVFAVTGAAFAALALGTWRAGERAIDLDGGGVLALLVAVLLAACAARVAGLHLPPARAQLVGVGVCCAAVAGCITGSNLVPGFLLPATTLLLAPACLLATRVLPEHGARAAVAAVSACLVAGSVVVAHQAYGEPKRGAPVAVSTVPVRLGPAVVRVDAGTAAQLDGIATAARSAGWRDGDRLLDASFTPAVPLALRAAVPPVLFPAFPGWLPSSVCSAVSGLDRGWRDAWVLVDTRLGEDALAEVTGAVGRRWPQDYVTVATLENRWGRSRPVLARPRPGAGAEKPAPAGCLAR